MARILPFCPSVLLRTCLPQVASLSVLGPSLILSQKRDVEKGAIVSQEDSSRPESQRSLDILDPSSRLQNPLAGRDKETLEADAVSFCEKHGLMDYGSSRFRKLSRRSPWLTLCDIVEDFKRGAVLAGFPHEAEKVEGLTPEELTALHDEKTNKWKQPWPVYYVAIISSMAAVVQGMEYVIHLPLVPVLPLSSNTICSESVVNGAQVFYYSRFGIADENNNTDILIQGLVNSAPYLCCAV